MKLGTENRRKTAVAMALFALALLLFVRTFLSGGPGASSPLPSSSPANVVPEVPAARAATPRRSAVTRGRAVRPRSQRQQPADSSFTASLDPRLRLDLLKAAEETTYEGSGRNIFRAEAEPVIPAPVAPAMQSPAASATPPAPPPPPSPPPINLRFFGFATSEGEPKKVFLASGDDVFIAGEGDIVNRRYKIIRIGNNSVEVEDLLSNRRESLPLAG